MRAAYYRVGYFGQPEPALTPVRCALDRAGIEVLEVPDNDVGKPSAPLSVEQCSDFADEICGRFKQGPGIDLWISEGSGPDVPVQVGPIVSKELAVPFVVLEPNPAIAAEDLKVVALEVMKQATHIATTSSATARYFEKLKLQPDCLTHLPTFVDVSPFQAAYKIRELHKSRHASKLRLPETSPWLLTDGAMEVGDSLQSYEVLAVALSRLVLMDWKLIVVASGNAMGEAKELMLRLPQDRIRYCDSMSPPDFAALCVSCDMYVWPAIGDASPGSLLEAQSSGVPVVAGSKDSTQDRVIDGRTGRLTPIGNAESFANAIGFLLRHPGYLQSFSEDARDTVTKQHDLDTAATRLGDVLSDLCQR